MVKPDNISMSVFINIFTYFITHVYIIISSFVLPIFVNIMSVLLLFMLFLLASQYLSS